MTWQVGIKSRRRRLLLFRWTAVEPFELLPPRRSAPRPSWNDRSHDAHHPTLDSSATRPDRRTRTGCWSGRARGALSRLSRGDGRAGIRAGKQRSWVSNWSVLSPPFPLPVAAVREGDTGRGGDGALTHFRLRATANLPDTSIVDYATTLSTGVHYGWARVLNPAPAGSAAAAHDEVFPMVMSIGWNPFYENTRRTAVSAPPPFPFLRCA